MYFLAGATSYWYFNYYKKILTAQRWSADGVGEEDQGDHDDGDDDDNYLQVLLEESAELDGAQALLLENRSTVSMMVMMTHSS